MSTIKIRQAKPLDASNLFRLLSEGHEESGVYPEVDPYMGLNWVTRTLSDGYVLVADVSGRIVGTLGLSGYQFPWSPQWYLYLEWLYVQKKFRKIGAFAALLKACHAYADDKQAPLLAGISSADTDVMLKDKAFQQNGYVYMGGQFLRSSTSGAESEAADDNPDVQTAVMG